MPVPDYMIVRNGPPCLLLRKSSLWRMPRDVPFVVAGYTIETIVMLSTKNVDIRMESMTLVSPH